ncbi:MAG: DUF5110 domain-containing protein [Bacteroidetes bacterium]|nr:DUF5110 domain-containing protein [Bacteroidota bacterium]
MNQRVFILLYVMVTFNSALVLSQYNNAATCKYRDNVTQIETWLSVIPYSDNVIRVVASRDSNFFHRSSLVVVRKPDSTIHVKKRSDSVACILETKNIRVTIFKVGGTISFHNKSMVVAREARIAGRSLEPVEVLGEKTFRIQQRFEITPDEAFYGLGQHQNGIFNYRGYSLDLWQYNIVAVVPFLVSSKNYGILWDNYSRTKYGDPREYTSIEVLQLLDRDGRKGGLTAEYYKDETFRTLYTIRRENRINHMYIDVNDPFPDGFLENVKSVRWSGKVRCTQSGRYSFRLYCSGYTKLWMNGKLVIDSWRQNWLPWYHFIPLEMEKGKDYDIRLEWIHTGGYIGLEVLPPGNPLPQNTISFTSEVGDGIDYYFIVGKTLDDVIASYRWLTGQAPMVPKWALGLWQSRERYRTQEELLSIVREFRKRSIPLDNIVQDWFYWEEDKWGDHEFDTLRYPDPKGMIHTLHNDLHTRIMISVWPKFYIGTKHYEEMRTRGYLFMRNVEKEQRDWVGPGYISTFYDPYSNGARELYWNQLKGKLFSLGVDAWWLDCTEPDIQSNLSREETILRQHPTAMGSGARYLNTYSLMNSRAVYEGQRTSDPNKRVYILTRSAFAGQQRYGATTWSGDVAARWYDLTVQIPAGLNFCLSGIPYWTTDIGGFAVEPRFENPDSVDREEWRELITRWFQFGTFCPIFRVHGQYPYREIFNVAPPEHPAYQAMVKYTILRYRLMPYIYTLAGMVTHHGYTIMRALVMDYSHDKATHSLGNQFLFGPALLVAPITEFKARSRTVYLPKGNGWYEIRTGKYYVGGQLVTAEAPYTDIPIFLKEGSILPVGPDIQYSTEKPADPIRLFVCGGRDAVFSIYEDDGETYDYEQGKYSWIPITYTESTKKLTLKKREGSFPGILEKRTFEIVWIDRTNKHPIDFNRKPDVTVLYDGNELTIEKK